LGADNQAIRASVGILTEAPGLYERLNAVQNLVLYAKLYDVENIDRQVKKYLQLLNLWDRRSEPVGGFSKGMKQKLAIARALLHEPGLVFLDEPTAALDPEASRMVRDFIREIKGTGRTIFLCTHNLDEADRLADRVGVINQELIQVDSPANLRKRLYGRHVRIQLNNINDLIVKSINDLPFVNSVERKDNALILDLQDPEKDNPIVVSKLVEIGAQVQFVQEMRHSLEDIYFTLLDNNDSSKGKEAG
jgi:ABC-2 type transport system ATP-binding protein